GRSNGPPAPWPPARWRTRAGTASTPRDGRGSAAAGCPSTPGRGTGRPLPVPRGNPSHGGRHSSCRLYLLAGGKILDRRSIGPVTRDAPVGRVALQQAAQV